MSRTRRRFVVRSSEDRRRRVVEVEVEPTEGIMLRTGERWTGVQVKARYPLLRDQRWTRCVIVEPLPDELDGAVELVALRILAGR